MNNQIGSLALKGRNQMVILFYIIVAFIIFLLFPGFFTKVFDSTGKRIRKIFNIKEDDQSCQQEQKD